MLNRPRVDLHSPDIFESYFRQLYQAVNTDKHSINELRQRLDFPEVAARFKLIEDASVPLVVRYPKEGSPVDDLLWRLQTPEALLGGEARRLLGGSSLTWSMSAAAPWRGISSRVWCVSCL